MHDHQKDKAAFLKDVAAHRMTVIRDEGLYRHLRFMDPETIVSYFDLITWPGHLCYTGDMGTYVFSRIQDMFMFFRRTPQEHGGPIDLRYWAEKCLSQDKSGGGITEFDADLFSDEIRTQRRALFRRRLGLTKDERRDCWRSLDRVIAAAGEGEHRAFQAAFDWHFKYGKELLPSDPEYFELEHYHFHRGRRDLELETSEFPPCRSYTTRFRWCCQALAWGIEQYDLAKAAAQPEPVAA